jgi:serine phosphatase RsbU (regulator of sigma subunit)
MLDPQEETFIYTNAGHNPPILFRDKEIIMLSKGGLILGVLPNAIYEEEKVQLRKGDLIFFYTDGIVEAQKDNTYFGIDRLLELIQANMSLSAEDILEKVLQTVNEFISDSSQNDDSTIIVLKYIG